MAGGELSGFTTARVAADAIKLHVVTQLVIRDVDGNEEAAKAVIVSLRERVAGQAAARQSRSSQPRSNSCAVNWRLSRLKSMQPANRPSQIRTALLGSRPLLSAWSKT